MTKEELVRQVTEYGDALIYYKSLNSNKLKYNVCTLDFSTPYISSKKNRATESKNTLLLFCWDTDSYRILSPDNVVRVEPLSSILKNQES